MAATVENPAAVLHGIRDLRIEARPTPEPGPGEVLVEVRAVGVCGSDVHYYEHGRIGDFVVRAPLVLGHETSGVVVDRAPDAHRHAVGQRVALEPGVPCGRCRECRRGRYNLCPDVKFFATPPVDGTFTRYVTIDEQFAHAMPDGLDDESGALIEPLSVAVASNRKGGTTVGSRVLVTGSGPIGVLCAQVARASGAGHVVITDINRERLDKAATLGADETLHAPDQAALDAVEADVLIECTGVADVVAQATAALRPAGVAVLVGMGITSGQTLPTSAIQARELTVTGVFRYANTYPEAIALAASGRVDLRGLVGERLPLEDAERALQMGHIDPSVLKTVVAVT
jgi:L-iditol 2-dehydrogenase